MKMIIHVRVMGGTVIDAILPEDSTLHIYDNDLVDGPGFGLLPKAHHPKWGVCLVSQFSGGQEPWKEKK